MSEPLFSEIQGLAPENTQCMQDNKSRIRHSAFLLLMEKGYDRTSYTDIAARSGITRALAQYYFPKKEVFLIDFVDRLLQCIDDYTTEQQLTVGSCFIDFTITGYLYFYFFLENEELRPLAFDLIFHRRTSHISIERMTSWQHRYSELAGIDSETIANAVLMSVGGAHELIYHYLEKDEPIDINLLLDRTILTYITLLGLDAHDFQARHEDYRLDEQRIVDCNAEILRRMHEMY